MRVIPVVLGGLLLVGGVSAVVLADQQREAAVEQARHELEDAETRLATAREINRDLAQTLTDLRVTIADQEDELQRTDGMLE